MTARAAALRRLDVPTLGAGTLLLALTAWSWSSVWRASQAMPMDDMGGMASFVLQWGVMMAAMMLPSAAPAILLYRLVRQRLTATGERAIPVPVFAATYLVTWTVLGLPVYAAWVLLGLGRVNALVAASVLFAAGIYQFTGAKRRCLAVCESPLSFFMTRWKSGYDATLGLALQHAWYCVGCCWALMLVLVGAGAMGIRWVAGIALIVFIEKCLPHSRTTSRLVGAGLLAAAAYFIV